MNMRTRSRITAALLLVLVAGAGFAAGVATERLLRARSEPAFAAPVAAPLGGIRVLRRDGDTAGADTVRRFRFLFPGRLTEDLDLTPEQRARIEDILREDQAAIRQITEQVEPALRAAVERSRQRIHEVLTEEQIERWHATQSVRPRQGADSGTPD